MPFPPYSPGLSNLRQMQNYVARQKPSYKTKKVGLLLTSMADLIAFSHAYSIPPTLALLNDAPSSSLVRSTVGDSLFIPMQAGGYGVHGACYTGKTQIGWIGQLAKMPGEWQVHLDGKYKLHHSQFLLFTLGTHYLRSDHHHSTLSNSFGPIIYLFCKEGESDGVCDIVIDALIATGRKYFGVKLIPGAGTSDHAPALRKAIEEKWPGIEYGQCYPHLIRKYGEGEFFKGTGTTKAWEHFEDAKGMIRDIHLAETTGMKYLIIHEVGKIWDKWGHQMDAFWDSNLTNPWDCWSICDMRTPCFPPAATKCKSPGTDRCCRAASLACSREAQSLSSPLLSRGSFGWMAFLSLMFSVLMCLSLPLPSPSYPSSQGSLTPPPVHRSLLFLVAFL